MDQILKIWSPIGIKMDESGTRIGNFSILGSLPCFDGAHFQFLMETDSHSAAEQSCLARAELGHKSCIIGPPHPGWADRAVSRLYCIIIDLSHSQAFLLPRHITIKLFAPNKVSFHPNLGISIGVELGQPLVDKLISSLIHPTR